MQQTDKKGSVSYSNIIKLGSRKLTTIYPNPVKDILSVEGLNTNSKTTLSIVDAQGKIIAITTTTANSVQQDIKQLSAGTYFVKIESNNEINTFKFVKQ